MDALDRRRCRCLPRLRRPQGPRAPLQGAVPGADLRRRVPARPLLRHHRRGGDRRGPRRSSSGCMARAHRAGRRGGAVQVPSPRERQRQAHRPHHRAPRHEDRLRTSRRCPASSSRTCGSTATIVRAHERMLTGGFYAEVELEYDAAIARRGNGRPFGIDRPASNPALDARCARRRWRAAAPRFTTEEWKRLLLRSVGFEPELFSARAQDVLLAAHGPVRRPQLQHGRARSAWHWQVAPLPADLAVLAPDLWRQGDRRADVRQQRDRPARARRASTTSSASTRSSGVSFDQKDGVNIMKGYMESGEFSRGRESIRADGSLVFVGQLRRRRRAPAADRAPVRAAAAGDA